MTASPLSRRLKRFCAWYRLERGWDLLQRILFAVLWVTALVIVGDKLVFLRLDYGWLALAAAAAVPRDRRRVPDGSSTAMTSITLSSPRSPATIDGPAACGYAAQVRSDDRYPGLPVTVNAGADLPRATTDPEQASSM